jgi:uncharacterized Ntn-hydrolase superfamily protein
MKYGMTKHGTFSILAVSKDRKFMGVAVASGSTAVGSRVPHAMPGKGVIATKPILTWLMELRV